MRYTTIGLHLTRTGSGSADLASPCQRAGWRIGAAFLAMSLFWTSPIRAQSTPKVTIASDSLPYITEVLRTKAESAGFTFQSAKKRTLLFTRNAGPQSLRGQMVPIVLEVTFHLEEAKPGTRVVPTEELVATINSGIEERRRPNPKERALFYQTLLDETKRQVENGGDSTAAAPAQ